MSRGLTAALFIAMASVHLSHPLVGRPENLPGKHSSAFSARKSFQYDIDKTLSAMRVDIALATSSQLRELTLTVDELPHTKSSQVAATYQVIGL
jgi:hypothetical protein